MKLTTFSQTLDIKTSCKHTFIVNNFVDTFNSTNINDKSYQLQIPFRLFTCSMNVIFLGCCCDILDPSDDDADPRPSLFCGESPTDLKYGHEKM